MKFIVISDNHDTLMGLRLAGITGTLTHDADGVRKALEDAIADPDVGVVLITEKLVSLSPGIIYDMKLNLRRPLVVEIPDRHAGGRAEGSIAKYIHDAIGINI